jgi:hypothetical protein
LDDDNSELLRENLVADFLSNVTNASVSEKVEKNNHDRRREK